MIRIYTDIEGIPASILSGLFQCCEQYQLVSIPAEADFFAFPCHYQVAYDYEEREYRQHGLDSNIKPLLLERFERIKQLSTAHQKPVIAFYLRDSEKPLPLENAIVFRSSLTRKGRQRNEFAYPANGRSFPEHLLREFPEFLSWTERPKVGFRGQSVAMRLPFKTAVKTGINGFLQQVGVSYKLATRFNFGYLQRRNAIRKLAGSSEIDFDWQLTSVADTYLEESRPAYIRNIFNNQYSLCVSGHGNYSFRFYEVMAAGRIPLFVNTDCVLPLEEIIDYKKLVVWIEDQELSRTTATLLTFHRKHNGHLLKEKQAEIKNTWQTYFQGNNFYRYLPVYLRYFT